MNLLAVCNYSYDRGVPGGRPQLPVPSHGTRARYGSRTHPCRCEACRAANAGYQAAYRGQAAPPPAVGRRQGHPGQLELPGVYEYVGLPGQHRG